MAHGDAREGKWRGNWRMEWVVSTLQATSEHGVSSITTADAHTSAANSLLKWRPRWFKWTRPFRRKTKSGFCVCAITFQTQSTYGCTRNYRAPLPRRMQFLHGSCRISFIWIRVDPVPPSVYIKRMSRYTRQRLKFQVEYDMWGAHSDFAEESVLLGCYTVPTDNYRLFEEI